MTLYRELSTDEILKICRNEMVSISPSDAVQYARALFKAARIRPEAAPAVCCVCGTTENLRKEGFYGYRCGSRDCRVF